MMTRGIPHRPPELTLSSCLSLWEGEYPVDKQVQCTQSAIDKTSNLRRESVSKSPGISSRQRCHMAASGISCNPAEEQDRQGDCCLKKVIQAESKITPRHLNVACAHFPHTWNIKVIRKASKLLDDKNNILCKRNFSGIGKVQDFERADNYPQKLCLAAASVSSVIKETYEEVQIFSYKISEPQVTHIFRKREK
ncbi:hypothetical protein E5288_WYG008030 [Bos mutus]|uniref:Uncharacterized protein n=1 Tax=Bos mutus TaxID=72004 RepID=A0A6B0RX09_9CETA|nr:hypothetical protein [Bos mutus]